MALFLANVGYLDTHPHTQEWTSGLECEVYRTTSLSGLTLKLDRLWYHTRIGLITIEVEVVQERVQVKPSKGDPKLSGFVEELVIDRIQLCHLIHVA